MFATGHQHQGTTSCNHRNAYLFACAICFLKREKIECSSCILIRSFFFADDRFCSWQRLVTILSQPNGEHPSLSPVWTKVDRLTEEGNLEMQNVFKKAWISESSSAVRASLASWKGQWMHFRDCLTGRCESEAAVSCNWKCNIDK